MNNVTAENWEKETTRGGNEVYYAIGELEPNKAMTLADLMKCLDQLNTHWLDTGRDNSFLSRWMNELEEMGIELDY